ncbi:MAG: hypothetical protein RL730_1017, partial [Actinomycetota bacterium]
MAITETEHLEGLWSGVIDSISQDSPQNRAFLTLTKPLGLLKSEGGSNLLLAAPNGFAKDVLESRLKGALNDALSAKLGERINIAVTIDESLDVPQNEVVEIEEAPRAGTGRQEGTAKPQESTQLNPRYIFETFVIGASNRFAHAAAVAVAEAPAKAYNPLFIYGESGLGKTHLLHAIGAYAKELYKGLRVRYVSSEEFT